MIRRLLLATGITVILCGIATPQVYEYSPSYDIDPKKATKRFAILFNDTCIRYRFLLRDLHSLAASRGWKESLGPFPFRHNEFTTLISWDILLAGSPTQLQLIEFDNTKPDITCVLVSYAMDASIIQSEILDNTPLFFHRRMPISGVDASLFVSKNEEGIRVICYAAPDIWLIGQCSLMNKTTPESEDYDKP